jgi:Asp-tRNA(Asn)/Glu-tRNA(Gln) amidotransferase A subunit family amidase
MERILFTKPMTIEPVRSTSRVDWNSEDFEKEFQRLSEISNLHQDGVNISSIQYAKAYREGKTTPLLVAQAIIKSVEDSDQQFLPLRSIIQMDKALLLKQAEDSTERIKNGNPLSILDGVPMSVKDQTDLQGYKTKLGTKLKDFEEIVQQEDAECIHVFRDYGAMFIGKTNMSEIGISTRSLNVHSTNGCVRNPFQMKHEVGGSSSGSAASVAVGFCPIAFGADGGGSIRIPASFCGIFGIKPTHSRISGKQKTRDVCQTTAVESAFHYLISQRMHGF